MANPEPFDFDGADLAARLPRGPEEPSNLRQDIADELADHWACGVRSELLGGNAQNAQEASARVRARFGNPDAIARQLWWGAMKEKVMQQRFMLAFTGLVAVAGIVMCAFVWKISHDSERAQLALIQAQRDNNAALMAELKNALAQSRSSSSDWLRISVRLVSTDKKPVKGSIYLYAKGSSPVSQTGKTDTNGAARFGLLPPGEYTVAINVDATAESSQRQVIFGPGRPSEIEIVCPTAEPELRAVKFEITPPAELAGKPLYYVAEIRGGKRQFGGDEWSSYQRAKKYLLIGTDGTVLRELESAQVERRHSAGMLNTYDYATAISELDIQSPGPRLPAYQSSPNLAIYCAKSGDPPAQGKTPQLQFLNLRSMGSIELNPNGDQLVGKLMDRYMPGTWQQVASQLRQQEFEDSKRAPH